MLTAFMVTIKVIRAYAMAGWLLRICRAAVGVVFLLIVEGLDGNVANDSL